jgi:hypothetical protein
MRRFPGEVWLLPAEAKDGGDPKTRRHVLLNPCDSADDLPTLAYTSTKATEAKFGATAIQVDPRSGGSSIGFTKPAFVYPSRLVAAVSDDLLRMTGRLVKELPDLRRGLRAALGLGTGTREGAGFANGSWRGAVVALSRAIREDLGFDLGVVVTEPGYSNEERYQLIVPLDSPKNATRSTSHRVVTDAPWVLRLGHATGGLLLAVDDVQAVFHPTDIESDTGVVVDDATMQQIEAALARLFLL